MQSVSKQKQLCRAVWPNACRPRLCAMHSPSIAILMNAVLLLVASQLSVQTIQIRAFLFSVSKIKILNYCKNFMYYDRIWRLKTFSSFARMPGFCLQYYWNRYLIFWAPTKDWLKNLSQSHANAAIGNFPFAFQYSRIFFDGRPSLHQLHTVTLKNFVRK